MMGKWARITAVLLFLCGILPGGRASAQTPAAPAPPAPAGDPAPEEFKGIFRGSFFLSPMELVTIRRAMAGKSTSAATLGVAKGEVPAHRIIRISGVAYRAAEDWIVWMNGQKVTPDNLLPEIIDIVVRDSSKVDLKWYDIGLNKVIAITLRPHQTYDIPTGILLPGAQ